MLLITASSRELVSTVVLIVDRSTEVLCRNHPIAPRPDARRRSRGRAVSCGMSGICLTAAWVFGATRRAGDPTCAIDNCARNVDQLAVEIDVVPDRSQQLKQHAGDCRGWRGWRGRPCRRSRGSGSERGAFWTGGDTWSWVSPFRDRGRATAAGAVVAPAVGVPLVRVPGSADGHPGDSVQGLALEGAQHRVVGVLQALGDRGRG